jgi:TrmH family RNA methyltransferase
MSDPKNVGTIIRSSDAAGADGVLISEDSADFYGPKAQRAAMGSSFHMPVEVCGLPAALETFHKSGGVIIAGSMDGGGKLPDIAGKNVCVVIGNESNGLSGAVKASADILYKIPMHGKAESLNAGVAAGIILYKIKQLKDEDKPCQ